jgi:hypothetical protein
VKPVLRWFGHVERMGDERIAEQVYKARVNKKRMKGRQKKSSLNVLQKYLENRNVRSIKNGRHERKCMNRPIMQCIKLYQFLCIQFEYFLILQGIDL